MSSYCECLAPTSLDLSLRVYRAGQFIHPHTHTVAAAGIEEALWHFMSYDVYTRYIIDEEEEPRNNVCVPRPFSPDSL